MTVSVIVPVFDGAALVAEAIDSVLGQTLGAHEIIVIDDGSTDATPDILARYAGRIVGLRQGNGGPASARNRGIERATGRYVMFLDADDILEPAALAAQVEILEQDDDADIAWARSIRQVSPQVHQVLEDWHGLPQWTLSLGSMMFRRAAVEPELWFDESMRDGGEDLDLVFRLQAAGRRFNRHPAMVQTFRLHGANHFSLDPVRRRAAYVAAVANRRRRQCTHLEGRA